MLKGSKEGTIGGDIVRGNIGRANSSLNSIDGGPNSFSALKIFGFGDGSININGEAGDVLYAAYLSMARAGITALEFWDPKSKKWGQPHMQARFSILKTFINAGKDFVSLKATKDDLSDLEIHLNRDKILSTGRKAVEAYLQKLHIYKATADVEEGVKMYNEITSVDEWWAEKVRTLLMHKSLPIETRGSHAQPNLALYLSPKHFRDFYGIKHKTKACQSRTMGGCVWIISLLGVV